jgi:hypothetical protein
MSMSTSVRIATAGLGAVAAVTLMPAATVHASDSGGPLCKVNQNTWVRNHDSYSGSVLYTIQAGYSFRFHRTNHQGTWAYGHGYGHSDGYIPNDGRLYDCHY